MSSSPSLALPPPWPTGINNSERIAGTWTTEPNGYGELHGYLQNGDQFTTLTIPPALESDAKDINGAGEILIQIPVDGCDHWFWQQGIWSRGWPDPAVATF